MKARMAYQKTARILEKECNNTLGTGAFDVNYEAPPPLEDIAMGRKRRRRIRRKMGSSKPDSSCIRTKNITKAYFGLF